MNPIDDARFAVRCASESACRSTPSSSTRPPSMSSRPEQQLSSVVLPEPGRTHDRDELALVHDEVDVAQRLDLFRAGVVRLAHAVGNQQRVGRVGHQSSIGSTALRPATVRRNLSGPPHVRRDRSQPQVSQRAWCRELGDGPARLDAAAGDLALGLQLEQMRVHLALRHLDEAVGRVGVERAARSSGSSRAWPSTASGSDARASCGARRIRRAPRSGLPSRRRAPGQMRATRLSLRSRSSDARYWIMSPPRCGLTTVVVPLST